MKSSHMKAVAKSSTFLLWCSCLDFRKWAFKKIFEIFVMSPRKLKHNVQVFCIRSARLKTYIFVVLKRVGEKCEIESHLI